ncbi:MAG: NADH:ubiquinone reductase (Na(+)-transporting) subunit C [Bacteroidia bacterium]
MSRNSTAYLIFFAAMVTLVAGVTLAITATYLKPAQDKNVALEKKKFILSAINFKPAEDTDSAYEEAYAKYITGIVVDNNGQVVEGEDAFTINPVEQNTILAENPSAQAKFPLYQYKGEDGTTAYIIPVNGKGLWGPIWGYIAVDEKYESVLGAQFDHKGETPGLGAEIGGDVFRDNFINKKIYDEDQELVAVTVLKGTGNKVDEHSVDGISGATITANGVSEMLFRDLKKYEPYFIKLNKNKGE